jgi:hypothetical protein
MKLLTKRTLNRLFKQATSTWFDENLSLKEHVTAVFAHAGFPVYFYVHHDDENDENEIYDGLLSNLPQAMAA